MSFTLNTLYLMLLTLLLIGCGSSKPGKNEPFADDRAAAVHILQPFFPILDCGDAGLISKGEVDDHFFQLFYFLDKRRSVSIRQEDLEHALFASSKEQVAYLFKMMDQNANGIVAPNEFRDFMYKAIDLADTENKGEITLADVGLEPPKIIRAKDR